MDWEKYSLEQYEEDEARLEENIAFLTAQNSVLGETLRLMLKLRDFAEFATSSLIYEDMNSLLNRLHESMKDLMEVMARESAELEVDNLKRRMNQLFDSTREQMARHSERIHRLEEKP